MSHPLQVEQLAAAKVFGPLDVSFARTLKRTDPDASELVLVAGAMVTRALSRGHSCVDLDALRKGPLLAANGQPVVCDWPNVAEWIQNLSESRVVGDGQSPTPLVLDDGGRIYLHRYWSYERRLAKNLAARVRATRAVDADTLADLARHCPAPVAGEADRSADQRDAVFRALVKPFCLISGGPGTGKTTTVATILAILQAQSLRNYKTPLRVKLAAPTGKAAQRLGEAIASAVAKMSIRPELAATIPDEAHTIHRILGFQPRTPTRFRHGVNHLIAADLVLVDEASMVDLALMAKLVEAVHPDARLLLLGDRDQLASVEAGSVLGDLDATATGECLSAALIHTLGEARDALGASNGPALTVPKLPSAPKSGASGDAASDYVFADCAVHLSESFRYDSTKGIGSLAAAIQCGDADAALSVLKTETSLPFGAVAIHPACRGQRLGKALLALVDRHIGCALGRTDPLAVLEGLNEFRILCSHRRGPQGVQSVNRLVEDHLKRIGIIRVTGEHYAGRPVMVTRNDRQLGLSNGDIGVVSHVSGRVQVVFPPNGGATRVFAPSQLPAHETVYAMTIHKSQGSEFGAVAVVLPQEHSPLLTRELIYTAISRAKDRVDVFASDAVLRRGIGHRVQRSSGLGGRMRVELQLVEMKPVASAD